MKIKNVFEMDYYELLNVDRDASLQEIERAYELCKKTYQADSIAYHSILSEKDREFILDRIEQAFKTLNNTKKRRTYDKETFQHSNAYKEKAFFRKTTEKILIEDSTENPSFWKKIRYFLFSPRK
jgi:DnaJ-class molecular chaperone